MSKLFISNNKSDYGKKSELKAFSHNLCNRLYLKVANPCALIFTALIVEQLEQGAVSFRSHNAEETLIIITYIR